MIPFKIKYIYRVFLILFLVNYLMAIACLTFLDSLEEYYIYFFIVGSLFLFLTFFTFFISNLYLQENGNNNLMKKFNQKRKKILEGNK